MHPGIIQKIRKYEIQIRKAITAHMQGDFRSVFKGSGLEFDDIRQYQYGDDVRNIDWRVSAKGHGTFVKTYREEKEQSVFLMLDVSASQEIGPAQQQKIDVATEICGVLALSAIKEASQVGLICFSDQIEKYIRPSKGMTHAYELIYELYRLRPASRRTNLTQAINYVLNTLRRRSIVILVSDFVDEGYQPRLQALARKHDLVLIHISDRRELQFPRLGIIPLYDKERGQTVWVNTASATFRQQMTERFASNRAALEQLGRRYQANYVAIDTGTDYVPDLIRLFKVRNRYAQKTTTAR